jgi:hypothetical protein
MKRPWMVIGFVAFMLPALLHAGTEQELKSAYRPATVVSVKKLATTVNYAYDISIRAECTLYVARYKSATDYVPVEIAPDHPVNVRVDGHWMRVFLSPNHLVELRLMSATGSGDQTCGNTLTGSSTPIPAGTILLRPVLMSSLATLLGLIPMALKLGTGSEAYAPLARAIIGGLLVSVAVTVYLVPAAYLWFHDKEEHAAEVIPA